MQSETLLSGIAVICALGGFLCLCAWRRKRHAGRMSALKNSHVRTSTELQSRRAAMKGRCSGWDAPDERCPRAPKDCVCWDQELANTGGTADG